MSELTDTHSFFQEVTLGAGPHGGHGLHAVVCVTEGFALAAGIAEAGLVARELTPKKNAATHRPALLVS